MAYIQIGGKMSRNGRSRIDRPFMGVIAGLSVNRLRVLDLVSERDPHVQVRGDVQLVTGVLDRNDLQRMQQVRATKWNHSLSIYIVFESSILRTIYAYKYLHDMGRSGGHIHIIAVHVCFVLISVSVQFIHVSVMSSSIMIISQ